MSKVIIAPRYVQNIDAQLIFLAGPIQGAERWQDLAIQLIQLQAPELYVASPRRATERGKYTAEMYNQQVDWETYHLRKAGENGVVMFWLAKEFEHHCSRAYAQTTRFELAEWKMRHEYEAAKLVVGIEEGFTGAKYIRRRFPKDCPEVSLCSTLEETCREAIRLARNS